MIQRRLHRFPTILKLFHGCVNRRQYKAPLKLVKSLIKDDVHYKNYTLSFYDHDNVRIMSLNVDYTGIVTISLYSEEKDVYVLHGNGIEYNDLERFMGIFESETSSAKLFT